jgi:hypothetical protein
MVVLVGDGDTQRLAAGQGERGRRDGGHSTGAKHSTFLLGNGPARGVAGPVSTSDTPVPETTPAPRRPRMLTSGCAR